MKNKTIKFLGTLFIAILLILIGNHVSKAAYAYISPVNNSQRNVTVGESVSIKAYGNAMTWNLKASGTGISGGSIVDGNMSEKKNKDFSQVYTLDTSKAGTYTLYLTGDITDADGTFSEISDSVTIVVSEKSSDDSNNNNNNNTNNSNEKEPSFTKTNDTVYSTGSVNVRKSYSTESSIIGSLSDGEEVKREATGDNGWSRITYNGGIGYVKTSLLTSKKPEEEKSTDKSLKSLKVKPEGLEPEFNPDTTIYSLTVGPDVDKVEVDAKATDEKAKVDVSGNEGLKDGENTIKIAVTAEDGTVRTYTINVTKNAKTNVVLKSLKIKGYDLSPEFNADVYSYKINVKDTKVTKLDIEAIASNPDFDVKISGNENLKNGQNIIQISVKSKDDSSNETVYKIYVNKSAESASTTSKSNDQKSKLPLFIGIGIIVLLIIAIIVIVIRNRRNYDDYYDEEEEEDNKIDKNLYGYSSKNDKQVEDKTMMYNPNNIKENQLDKVEDNDDVDEEFDFNPYTKNGISSDYNNTSRAPGKKQDRDLFGTINGVDESYKYTDNSKDDLSEALNKYKEQEKQENNGKGNIQNNASSIENNKNNETYNGVNSFDYNSYLENSYGFDDDDRGKKYRGRHSK